ncbi:MAG TPA: WhiB family transcriptional regulator [Acidimicrobiales bacterium]|jgi:WhiB family redox-sensing transcriptional regulator
MAGYKVFDWDTEAWRRQASCRDSHPDLFFPVGATGQAVDAVQEAKRVCQECAVRGACLEFALITNQDCGVWGGTSEEERRRLRRSWLAERRRERSG